MRSKVNLRYKVEFSAFSVCNYFSWDGLHCKHFNGMYRSEMNANDYYYQYKQLSASIGPLTKK
jgi:hypothetical protein